MIPCSLFLRITLQRFSTAAVHCSRLPKRRAGEYWDRSDIPGDAFNTENAEILFKDFPFEESVLADMITGKVYEIPEDRISKSGEYVVFRNIPVLDSPFLIAEKRLLHLSAF